jgi:hypothetical protein
VFGSISSISGSETILEVLDKAASTCPKPREAFPTYSEIGPSTSWGKATAYAESSAMLGNSPLAGGELVVKAALDTSVYCTHKVVITSVEGYREIGVNRWDDHSMTIGYGVKQTGAGDPGSHIALSLLVRYLDKRFASPQEWQKLGCTAPPPPNFNTKHQRLRQTKLADGSIFFEY